MLVLSLCALALAGPPAAVTPLADAPVRTHPAGVARVQVLSRGDNAFVARLVLAPGVTLPEHRDATEEVVHVLRGTGTVTIDGRSWEVGPGHTLFMPAGALVSYVNGPEESEVVQVFAGPEPAAKYDAWTVAP
ncbi:MAG: cupin domain-containing protein [Alphaproteobacteria bacterium]|nr:cupin domain-containing protein [Alphaproteobacteria bacterium]